jgi:hypothetical protein
MSERPAEGLGSRLVTAASRMVDVVNAVADADPDEIETAARRLGSTRSYLAPVAWVAGMLVLVVRGIKLLLTNWRLLALEIVPATWVWVTLWDLRREGLRAPPLQHVTVGEVVLAVSVAAASSIAALWCNCVFGFAVSQRPTRVRPAIRKTWPHRWRLVVAGFVVGAGIAAGFAAIPRLDSLWVYLGAVWAMYGIMLTALVWMPAWVIGIQRHKFGPIETVQRWVTGWALAAVAITPGFLVARFGDLLIGVSHRPSVEVLGYVVLTLGAVLYIAGVSSVKAVTLSMKLEIPESESV